MVYETLFWIGALGVGAMSVMGFASHASHGVHHHGGGHGHAGNGPVGGHGGPNGHTALGHGHTAAGGGHNGGIGHADVGHGSAGSHAPATAAHAPAHHTPSAHHTPANGGAGHSAQHGSSGGNNGHHHHQAAETAERGPAAEPMNGLLTLASWLSPMTLFSVALGAGATGLLLSPRLETIPTAVAAAAGGAALNAFVVRPITDLVQRAASRPAAALEGVIAGEAVAQGRFDAQGRGIVTVVVDEQNVRLLAHLERDDREKGVTVAPGERLVVTQVDTARNECRVTRL